MGNFCTRCGSPLVNGVCSNCDAPDNNMGDNNADTQNNGGYWKNQNGANSGGIMQDGKITIDTENVKTFWEKMKNRMGIGTPELNSSDTYEEGKKIIPDCVKPNEGEVPIKQYRIAKLRSRVIGIPYTKAIGRIQVTNKRVIFRAPGRSIAGRTTLQQEFKIDELAGVEARREHSFNFWDLLIGWIVTAIGCAIATGLMTGMVRNAYSNMYDSGSSSMGETIFLAVLLGVLGCLPFFLIKKKWLIKILCLGASIVFLYGGATYARYASGTFLYVLIMILTLASLICWIFAIIINSIKPNLVLVIKNKVAINTIDIQRKKIMLFGWHQEEHTGYMEVIPEDDAELAIKEINAMITDVQKLGDAGIDKWGEE